MLLSATGELIKVDIESGKYEVINQMPGFVRGLGYYKDYLFVGLSRLRKRHVFGDLPIAKKELFCGIVVIHLPTGAKVGRIKYENSCEELYDVQILPNQMRPNILNTQNDTHLLALTTPKDCFWGSPIDTTTSH